MKITVQLMIVAILMMAAAPAYSADAAMQYYKCQQNEEAADEQLEEVASAWLKAAKGMRGGENLKAYLNFPVVAQMGDYDFFFVIVAPSLAEWGEFMAGYSGSPAEAVDEDFGNLADCPDSVLFEGVKVE
jgi:hypothetical protein